VLSPNHYAAIDPLALLLPSSVYQRLIEKWHPHIERAEIREAVRSMSPEEKTFALARAKVLVEYGTAVKEEINAIH
jgi:hypothetical protein